MADPRFYENQGPFALADLCGRLGIDFPDGADGAAQIFDAASLETATPRDLSFCANKDSARTLPRSRAGFCLIGKEVGVVSPPHGMIAIYCTSASHAFASALNCFYPDSGLIAWGQKTQIDRSARIGEGASQSPGVVIGPGVEIGARTCVGPNAVIGRGVTIGSDCEIGSNVSIANAYIGDRVSILPGAQIGQPGFGFASNAAGHTKIPQVGRVIIQDEVEIGACSTIDRGALGDTIIGEGTKIDNLVQIGHNTHIGRHCMIVSQVGISGSCEIGDFVVLGGQAGIADHVTIGDGARFAARSGVFPGTIKGGVDYGGVPARPVKEWLRDMVTITRLGKPKKRNDNG